MPMSPAISVEKNLIKFEKTLKAPLKNYTVRGFSKILKLHHPISDAIL
jgi:hypothetical protein